MQFFTNTSLNKASNRVGFARLGFEDLEQRQMLCGNAFCHCPGDQATTPADFDSLIQLISEPITEQGASETNLVNKVYPVGDLLVPVDGNSPIGDNQGGFGGGFGDDGNSMDNSESDDSSLRAVIDFVMEEMSGAASTETDSAETVNVYPVADLVIPLNASGLGSNEKGNAGGFDGGRGGFAEGGDPDIDGNRDDRQKDHVDVELEVSDLLDQLRRLHDTQIVIEVRFITLNDNFFENIGVDFDFDVEDTTDVTSCDLDDEVNNQEEAKTEDAVTENDNDPADVFPFSTTMTVQLPVFPIISVSTTVSVPDGGTVLMGGIKRLNENRHERGLPILSKVPYINRLFKNVGIGREAKSLMMMVTPRIIIQEE